MASTTSNRTVGGTLLVAGLAMVVLAGNAVVSAFEEFGVVDRRATTLRFAVSLLGAMVTAYGAHTGLQDWIKKGSAVVKEVAVLFGTGVVVAGAVLVVYVVRPDSEFEEGALSADDPFAQRVLVSGGNGHRYYITFTPSGSLNAEVQLRGGGQRTVGTLQDGGTQVIEGVLVGEATWTTVLRYIDGEGKYLLFIDSAEPEELVFGADELRRAFEPGRSRTGFVFDVARRQNVFVRVGAAKQGDPNPGLVLRDSGGTPIDNVPPGEDGQIFTTVPADEYVLEVLGQPAQRFRIVLGDSIPGRPGDEPPEPVTRRVAVPDVARQPEQMAVRLLTDAGFVVQSYAVCSESLFEEQAAVGTTRQVVRAGAGSVSGEEEIVGLDGVVVEELPAATRLDVKVFNGLPCRAD